VPGGLLERGETLREACLRELREETGLFADLRGEVKVLERIMGPQEQPDYHYLIVDFWGFVAGGTLAPGSDVRDARWIPVDEVPRLPGTYGLADVVQRALALCRAEEPASPLFEVAHNIEA
jgi:ADP-ribose pyrophosphatase YjhB (NUDIX family)